MKPHRNPPPYDASKLTRFADMVRREAIPLGLVGFEPLRVEAEVGRSLALLEVLENPKSLVDVGSGAGFPGVPLAVALGRATLIEPRRRAVAFLEKVARELDLEIEIVPKTAQEAGKGQLRESADAVTARAVAPPTTAVALCSPLCKVGGLLVLTAYAATRRLEIPNPLLDKLGLSPPTTTSLGATLEIRQQVHIMRKVHTSFRRNRA